MPHSTHSSTVLTTFQSLFSTPTLNQVQGRLWRKVQRLIIGTLLACGRRSATAAPGSRPGSALRHTGQGDTPSFSLYHQVLNRARWSVLKDSRCLLSLLVQTFGAVDGTVTFVLISPAGLSVTTSWSTYRPRAGPELTKTADPHRREAPCRQPFTVPRNQ